MNTLPAVRVASPTEQRNPRTINIDVVSTVEMLRLINGEDRVLADAVGAVIPDLARLVDETVVRLEAGGRLHYFGAGTSGRLAVMDAAELIPTFGLPPGVVVAHHAGGTAAMVRPIEGTEDSIDLGYADAAEVTGADVVVGITASGRTPYVEGALRAAAQVGAFTALISANPDAALAGAVDVHLGVATGPEAIAGSTRLKAATAHKLVLNSLSTAVMVSRGSTYSNFMVNVAATNNKLRGRTVTILVEATGLDESRCVDALVDANGDLKTALVSLLAECNPAEARQALAAGRGRVRTAVAALCRS